MTTPPTTGRAACRPPTIADIAALAERLLKELPEPFARLLAPIPVRVEEWPTEEVMADLGVEDPLEITGLYRAVPVGERENLALPPAEPEMIFLYRMPILFEWCERGCALEEVVADVLVHEIGHHFGMGEEQARALERRSQGREEG